MLQSVLSPEVIEQLSLIVASKATPECNVEELAYTVFNAYKTSYELLDRLCVKDSFPRHSWPNISHY